MDGKSQDISGLSELIWCTESVTELGWVDDPGLVVKSLVKEGVSHNSFGFQMSLSILRFKGRQ